MIIRSFVLRQNPAYRPRNLPLPLSARGRAVALVAGTMLGCARSVPVQVMTPAPTPASVPAPPRTISAWSYRPSSAPQSFITEQTALLTIRADTAVRADSVTSTTRVSFAQSGAGRVSGSVTGFVVRSGVARGTPPGVSLPVAFAAAYSAPGRQLSFSSPADAGTCSPQVAVLQSVRDLWFRGPDSMRVGSAWADSATYVVCRDGVPLQLSVFRTFRVTGAGAADGRTLLTVARTARLSVSGESVRGGDTTRVSGTGSGELVYRLDPEAGVTLSASGTSVLDLFVRARARAQSVRQASSIVITPGR